MRILPKAVAVVLAAVGAEVAYAYLWPAPRQAEFDVSAAVGPPDADPLTVAALGDSTLTGPGVGEAAEVWVRVAMQRLAEATGRGIELRSWAQGGATSGDVLADQVDPAVELGPDLALVSVGANDVIRGIPVAKMEANLDRVVARLAATGAVVVLSGVGDLGAIPRLAPPLRQMASRLGWRADRAHARVAARHGVLKAEQWGWSARQFRTRRDVWSPDRFHPNAAGHVVWAETCWEVLAPLVGRLAAGAPAVPGYPAGG